MNNQKNRNLIDEHSQILNPERISPMSLLANNNK